VHIGSIVDRLLSFQKIIAKHYEKIHNAKMKELLQEDLMRREAYEEGVEKDFSKLLIEHKKLQADLAYNKKERRRLQELAATQAQEINLLVKGDTDASSLRRLLKDFNKSFDDMESGFGNQSARAAQIRKIMSGVDGLLQTRASDVDWSLPKKKRKGKSDNEMGSTTGPKPMNAT
jgi:hypothetical protein